MNAGTHIRVLPVHVANKIAAGEVVERPASVVKELLENALDAGASRIEVAVTAGGRRLIAVTDNGRGMSRDDALLSIERQATSKIRDVDDIERILTLGFRGEALAAIASVSRFRLATCAEGELTGTEITLAGGKMQDVREAGGPVGTTVEVRDLFFNVPARRKFLRTQQTELAHVRSVFIVQALAAYAIGMSLKVDGRDVYRLAGDGAFIDRLRDLFGPDYLNELVRVDAGDGDPRVSGYVSRSGWSRADRDEQYIFVNGRATHAPLIHYAIREAYRTQLPRERHPSVFLFVDTDPTQVDVNVHPTKREVRFRQPSRVRDGLLEAIRRALGTAQGAADAEAPPEDGAVPRPASPVFQMRIENLPETRSFQYPRAVEQAPDDAGMHFAGIVARPAPAPAPSMDAAGTGGGETAPDGCPREEQNAPWSWCRVVGLVGGRYVVLETEDGFVLMDPRAAHERVLYERFLADVRNHHIAVQSLLMPETVELRPKDAVRVRKQIELLKEMGFGVSEFGGDAFVVDAMPAAFGTASPSALLAEIALGLETGGSRRQEARWREDAIARAACHCAVRSKARLKLEEIEKLVLDLSRAEMPYTCPQGKPTLIFTSYAELNRKFGRD